jgi:DNA-binding NarL/FixJ family response regulator
VRLYVDPDELRGQPLTARQSQLIRTLAEGNTNQQLAVRFGIAPQTVRHHFSAAYRKWGVRNRTAAALKALRLDAAEYGP